MAESDKVLISSTADRVVTINPGDGEWVEIETTVRKARQDEEGGSIWKTRFLRLSFEDVKEIASRVEDWGHKPTRSKRGKA